ncbi:hypothetical protein H4R18_005378 [Coemansia javaensis]|uniref:Tyrosinase copper-binding domain-containing protein n=1 Tax=Coemansia javaensis TaxID=2761396 RepID=A0A9W8H1R1_9FUNG|nr:hypothetical protein H4R18_005378 [Coemansia javaensis]
MRIRMLVFLAAAVPAALGQAPAAGLAKCGGLRVRRSAHDLSPDEWQRIGRVVAQLHSNGHFDRFARAHNVLFDSVHGTAAFFPFHRRFVQEFEDLGRQIDPEFTVPYWDSTRDSRDPASSSVLQDDTLGGNGQGPGRCLRNGIQGQWGSLVPRRHCLRRDFNDGDAILPWVPAEVISSFLQTDRRLADFSEHIEYSIHGAVHIGLGGDAGTRVAPNDLFFYMHHANIDRLWWQWQVGHRRVFDYNGPGPNGEAVLDDVIPQTGDVSFGGAQVRSVMVLGYGTVCYAYDSAPPPPASYPRRRPPGPQPGRGRSSQAPAAPVLSGGSNATSAGLEAARIHGALSGDPALKKYFPGIAALAGPDRSIGAYDDGSALSCAERRARRLVHPAPVPEAWIRMHNFDPARVRRVYDEMYRLIDQLNNSTYVSPY